MSGGAVLLLVLRLAVAVAIMVAVWNVILVQLFLWGGGGWDGHNTHFDVESSTVSQCRKPRRFLYCLLQGSSSFTDITWSFNFFCFCWGEGGGEGGGAGAPKEDSSCQWP